MMGTDATERRRRARPWRPSGQAVHYALPELQDLGAELLDQELLDPDLLLQDQADADDATLLPEPAPKGLVLF